MATANYNAPGMAGYDLPVWPYRRHADQDRPVPVRHPVVVVGGGLVGLSAALDLSLRDVPVVVLDDDDTIGVRGLASRGICYAKRTLEILNRLGVADEIARRGITWQVGRVLNGGDSLYTFNLQPEPGQRFPAFINIQQFYVEWFLAERLMARPNAEIRWRNKVRDATVLDDGVRLTIETPDGPYDLVADWVVAADGVNSQVRQALHIEPKVEAFDDRWCISDIRLPADFPTERWTWVEAPFNDNKAVWRHKMADNVWRLDCQLGPDGNMDAASQLAAVQDRVRGMLGPGVPYEVIWVGPWAYRSYVLDAMRHGRVLFAGDAAHLMSPFGARGGNSGIQDADNLAWKLALVVKDEAPERLLDSYDVERRHAAHFNVATTRRSGRFLAPRKGPEATFREAVLRLAKDQPFARAIVDAGRMSSPADYAGLPTVAADDAGFAAGPRPGQVAVHAPLGEANVVDLLGEGFVLLAFTSNPPVPLPGLRVVHVPDDHGEAWRRYDAAPRALYLIRPDHHVQARWRTVDMAAVQTELDRARGRA
jgi:3-(3-hydroxy-phenyl)propionate hydroxylase